MTADYVLAQTVLRERSHSLRAAAALLRQGVLPEAADTYTLRWANECEEEAWRCARAADRIGLDMEHAQPAAALEAVG